MIAIASGFSAPLAALIAAVVAHRDGVAAPIVAALYVLAALQASAATTALTLDAERTPRVRDVFIPLAAHGSARTTRQRLSLIAIDAIAVAVSLAAYAWGASAFVAPLITTWVALALFDFRTQRLPLIYGTASCLTAFGLAVEEGHLGAATWQAFAAGSVAMLVVGLAWWLRLMGFGDVPLAWSTFTGSVAVMGMSGALVAILVMGVASFPALAWAMFSKRRAVAFGPILVCGGIAAALLGASGGHPSADVMAGM